MVNSLFLQNNLVEQRNILYDFINVKNLLKELYVLFTSRRKTLRPLAKMQGLGKAYMQLTTDRLFQE